MANRKTEGPMNCPTCRSANVQRVEMAWSTGTRTGSIVGMDGAGDVAGGLTSSSSLLSQSLSPPTRPFHTAAAGVAFGAAVLVLFGGTMIAMVVSIICAVAGVAILMDRRRALAEWEPRFQRWRSQWVCLACGVLFVPAAGAISSAGVCRSCRRALTAGATRCSYCRAPVVVGLALLVLFTAAPPAAALAGGRATGSAVLTFHVDLPPNAVLPPEITMEHNYLVAVGDLSASDTTPTIFGIGRTALDGSSASSDAAVLGEADQVVGMTIGAEVRPVGLGPSARSGLGLVYRPPFLPGAFTWGATATWAYDIDIDLEGACGTVWGSFSVAGGAERSINSGLQCGRYRLAGSFTDSVQSDELGAARFDGFVGAEAAPTLEPPTPTPEPSALVAGLLLLGYFGRATAKLTRRDRGAAPAAAAP